jgi:hypothetical protein
LDFRAPDIMGIALADHLCYTLMGILFNYMNLYCIYFTAKQGVAITGSAGIRNPPWHGLVAVEMGM